MKVADKKSGKGNNVAVSTVYTVYTVSVYATKAGMANSEVATANITVKGLPSGGTLLKGDVNEDGVVSITDAVTIVNIIQK